MCLVKKNIFGYLIEPRKNFRKGAMQECIRLRLAEKKRFTYKSAYLYEQIRKISEAALLIIHQRVVENYSQN